jgi:hypothetical protein
MDHLVDPTAQLEAAPEAVGTLPDGYQRMVELLRPLTSLETRVKTSNFVEDEDYDSPPDDNEGFDIPQELAESSSSAAQHQTEFPGDITITGFDEHNRKEFLDLEKLWMPFRGGFEFKLARWMMESNLSKDAIDKFFNMGLARTPPPNQDGSSGICFTSAYTLGNLLDSLDPELNIKSWKTWAVDHVGTGLIEFKFRSVEAMIRHIFKQPVHEPYMVYKPIKEYDGFEKEYQLFSDLYTADWWWNTQVCGPSLLILF